MLKSTLLLIIGVLALGMMLNDDGVFVSHNTPESMEAGSTETVTVVINKSQLQGFGKLLLEVPQGFSIEAVDTREASFTFEEKKAKFIWMVMPAAEEFTVTYNLIAPSSFKGVVSIKGIFSYIKNNQRVDYEIPEKTIQEGTPVVAQEDAIVDNTIIDNVDISTANLINVENLGCKRELERVADDKVLVTLTVYESELRGFGKVQDSFDAKYEIIEGDSDGAITTFEDGSVKYVWFEVPGKNEFYVSYYIQHADLAFEMPEINGAFTYVYDDKPVEISIIQVSEIEPVSDPIADLPDPIIKEDDVVVVTDPIVKSDPVEPKMEAIVEKVSVSNIPDPENGITYKVQIIAGPNTVGKAYMKKTYGFYDNFNIENHEGWVKYTTGGYGEYKSARDQREKINTKYSFDGPFVTAYNSGVRITVQEAIMITNQQWYQ